MTELHRAAITSETNTRLSSLRRGRPKETLPWPPKTRRHCLIPAARDIDGSPVCRTEALQVGARTPCPGRACFRPDLTTLNHFVLTRLPQLGGHEDANSLNSLDRLPEGRHYKAANGEAAPCAVRRRSGVRVAAARSCRAVAAVARAPCSAGCGAAGRGAGRRWLADGRPPSGWWRRPQGWRVG